jgi:hypothetical protein
MTRKTLLITAAVLLCVFTGTAHAQTPLSGGDLSIFAASLNVNKSALTDIGNNDWYNRALYGGGTAGWYWTAHHKTEVEVGASTAASFWAIHESLAGGVSLFERSRFTFSTRRVAIGQQYQFFRNAWFHPHLAAGADLTWETATQHVDPVVIPASGVRTPQVIPARVVGPETRVRVRPFGEAGFKAYMTRRAFVRGDIRVFGRSGIDEVQLRAGLGIDF